MRFKNIILSILTVSMGLQVVSHDFSGYRITLAHVAILAGLFTSMVYFINRDYEFKYKKSHVDYLLALYFVIMVINTMFAHNHALAIRGLVSSTLIISCYYVYRVLCSDRMSLSVVANSFIAIGIITALEIYFQFFTYLFLGKETATSLIHLSGIPLDAQVYRSMGYAGGFIRSSGFFYSTNAPGSFLLVPLAFSIHKIYMRPEKKSYRWLLISLFIAGSIFFTLSRNSMIGLFMLYGLFIFATKKEIIKLFLKKSFFVYASLISPFVVYLLTITNKETGLPLVVHIVYRSFNESSTIFLNHLYAAFMYTFSHYGLGAGMQNFDDWAIKYNLVETWGAHSNFIYFIGENGIFGLLIQLLIGFIFLYRFVWIKKSSNSNDKVLAALLLSAYISLLFVGLVRTFYFAPHTFALMAIIINNYTFPIKNKFVVSQA